MHAPLLARIAQHIVFNNHEEEMFCVALAHKIHKHHKSGFFMNWLGKLPAGEEGYEYHLLVPGMCLVIFILGEDVFRWTGILGNNSFF
jgi:hypothetical protein